MQYGLKQQDIDNIQNVFSAFNKVEKAILYGSRAKGNYKPASDIDITLIGENLDITLINRISLALDDLLLPYTFDLSIFSHIKNEDLLDHINRIGIVFYIKEEKI
jgi:predicted nucleotidyltransferase